MKYKATLFSLLFCISPCYGIEMPEDFNIQIAKDMSKGYCTDIQFTQCLGTDEQACTVHMQKSVAKCDYSPLWQEFNRKEEAGDDYVFDRKIQYKIGECVNSELRKLFGVSDSQYEQCLVDHSFRLKESMKAKRVILEE
ncbi:hypothetical protein [Candidatus Thiodiazotropha sp. LNASS1]|uniref:hypothetical protein n=1 Tax=Candidatus Thiodiazotropha sp. LNASS1 TaxID=3096260 RepID=UPI0034E03DC5